MESRYFRLSEVEASHEAKRLGIDNSATKEVKKNAEYLAKNLLDKVREHFGVPIYISSWYRSPALNKKIKGSSTSLHLTGCAVDIDMDGRNSVSNKQVFEYIKDNMLFTELICEHPDSKGNPAWVHVGLVKGREEEMEVLIAKRNKNGKTTYSHYPA